LHTCTNTSFWQLAWENGGNLQYGVANFGDPRAPMPLSDTSVTLLWSGHVGERKMDSCSFSESVMWKMLTEGEMGEKGCFCSEGKCFLYSTIWPQLRTWPPQGFLILSPSPVTWLSFAICKP